jgi:hypothetical protein
MLRILLAAACAAPLTACFVDRGSPPVQCTPGETFAIDLDETFQYTPGVDAGWYITYVGAGQWHLEWTCDTKLSADGCEFSGAIVADAPSSGPNATCYLCENGDSVSAAATSAGPAGEPQMEIDFDTITTTGVDGVDFTSLPGTTITLDLAVNGLDQSDLVNFVSGGVDAAPACAPFALTPPDR